MNVESDVVGRYSPSIYYLIPYVKVVKAVDS